MNKWDSNIYEKNNLDYFEQNILSFQKPTISKKGFTKTTILKIISIALLFATAFAIIPFIYSSNLFKEDILKKITFSFIACISCFVMNEIIYRKYELNDFYYYQYESKAIEVITKIINFVWKFYFWAMRILFCLFLLIYIFAWYATKRYSNK